MPECSFELRYCPACGGAAAPDPEASSTRRAEHMSLDEVRPFWSGLFKEKTFFSYHRCCACGLLFAPTYFTKPQLGELYAEMAPNMEVVPVGAIEATQRDYFQAVKSGALDGSYLEIGPDVGYVAGHAAREGAFDRFWLFEPNQAVHAPLAEAVDGRRHEILPDMEDLSAVPDNSVGLAVMVHVLDHIVDPLFMLTEIKAKLKPGGQLLIVTHNEKSLLRSLMGMRWPPFCLQHPELYNPQSITQLLKRSGYGKVKVSRSKNYFPLAFMAQQAAWRFGLKIDKLPLPGAVVGLKLGNMITVAGR
jgi:SAM-dependent methyltransferase